MSPQMPKKATVLSMRQLVNKVADDLRPVAGRPEAEKVAISTSRSKGAVGRNPLVYRKFRELLEAYPALKDLEILDFGAGKDAKHAYALKEEGCSKIRAFDFQENCNTNLHFSQLGLQEFDVILLSNVLNVQRGSVMLENTLDQVADACRLNALLVCNYPATPRYYAAMTNKIMLNMLRFNFNLTDIKGPQDGKGALVIVGRRK